MTSHDTHTRTLRALLLCAALLLAVGVAVAAEAQLAVSANDSKVMLVNGVVRVVKSPPPDTATVIDLGTFPPRIVIELNVPASAVGPPLSVAVTPDESLALVTASMRVDPTDSTKQAPHNRLTVIDLKASPPVVIAALETGRSPAGLSINRQGTLALVANRGDGTVSVFGISGKTVTPRGRVVIADEKAGVSHVAFTPDGKMALVTRDNDFFVSVLSVTDGKVEYTRRDLTAGIRPYGLDISPDGTVAAVANIGRNSGDNDTISLIDLKAAPPRVVETVTVGQTPAGILFSPDGKLLAVVVMNGSNKPRESPFHSPNGKLLLYRVSGTRLLPASAVWIGGWSQGVAFSSDSRTILVQNMVEREIWVFRWDGARAEDTGYRIKVSGGPAGIRTRP
jgi:DNA-binding beta-propeller fold protein YncE